MGYTLGLRACQIRHRSLAFALVLSALVVASCRAQDSYQEEADRLAVLLSWPPGRVVGDIGAGEGQLTLAAAKYVGKARHVNTTELDTKKLTHLEELAGKEKNFTTIKAGEAGFPRVVATPSSCGSSIITSSSLAEIDASLSRSLKPGGLLAVIDEEPPPGCAGKGRRTRHAAENPDRGA
jgi:predicted methyltransferase